MSHAESSGGGNNAVGLAIGAAFLILFLNGPAPDTTKFAALVGVIVWLVASGKIGGKKEAGGGH